MKYILNFILGASLAYPFLVCSTKDISVVVLISLIAYLAIKAFLDDIFKSREKSEGYSKECEDKLTNLVLKNMKLKLEGNLNECDEKPNPVKSILKFILFVLMSLVQ